MQSLIKSSILPVLVLGASIVSPEFSIAQIPPQIDIIARTGTPAPGALPGQTFVLFRAPFINNNGDIAFTASFNGGSFDNSGIWISRVPEPLSLVVREGMAITATTRHSDFYSPVHPMALSHGGHVTYVSNLVGPESRNAGASVWSTRTGSREQLGRANQTALLGGTSFTLNNFVLPLSAPEGYTLYTSNNGNLLVQDAGEGAPSRRAIASLTNLTPTMPYVVGIMRLASMNSGGLALVEARGDTSTVPTFIPSLIQYNTQGDPTFIVEGRTDTTLFPGTSVANVLQALIADDGTIAFTAVARGSGPIASWPRSLFYIRNSQRREILAVGARLPILQTSESVTDWLNLDLSADGQLLVRMIATNSLSGLSRQIVALYRGDGWVQVARQGDPAPGISNRFFAGSFNASMSSNGIVLLRSSMVDDSGTPAGEATWLNRASRGLSLLLTDRVLIDVDPGPGQDFRIMQPSWQPASGTVVIEGSSINTAGVVAAAFTDINNNQFMVVGRVTPPNLCDSIDFNGNGVFPENQDVIDFFSTLAGSCPLNQGCDIDFNNNGVFPEDQDVIDFFQVLAGGSCL
jgi:hypothetical protein